MYKGNAKTHAIVFLKFKPLSPEMILNKITNSAFLDSEKDESLDKYSSGITIIADG